MLFSRGVTVLVLALGFLPAVIRIVLTRRARHGAWEIVAAGLQGANLVPFFAAFVLPVRLPTQLALFAVGVALGVWSVWSTVREYRRSKAAERRAV